MLGQLGAPVACSGVAWRTARRRPMAAGERAHVAWGFTPGVAFARPSGPRPPRAPLGRLASGLGVSMWSRRPTAERAALLARGRLRRNGAGRVRALCRRRSAAPTERGRRSTRRRVPSQLSGPTLRRTRLTPRGATVRGSPSYSRRAPALEGAPQPLPPSEARVHEAGAVLDSLARGRRAYGDRRASASALAAPCPVARTRALAQVACRRPLCSGSRARARRRRGARL